MQRLGLRLAAASGRAPPSVPRFTPSRKLHQRQPLPYPVEEGLGKFLPPDALKVQLEWHDGLLERLNEEVANTGEANSSIAQTVINLSGNKSKILAFNCASLALNNSFFLDNLKPSSRNFPTHECEIASSLMQTIREHHGGIQQLRSAFSAAALGTFTNGWVWFVSDQTGKTSTTTTYGPGTLLIRSRMQMQMQHSATLTGNSVTSAPSSSSIPSTPLPGSSPMSSGFSGGDMPLSSPASQSLNSEASFMSMAPGLYSTGTSAFRPKPKFSTIGEFLYPLFCIPIYEHAWMSAGYGVWGKEEWLKEFWSVLNWQKVNAAYDKILSSYQPGNYS